MTKLLQFPNDSAFDDEELYERTLQIVAPKKELDMIVAAVNKAITDLDIDIPVFVETEEDRQRALEYIDSWMKENIFNAFDSEDTN